MSQKVKGRTRREQLNTIQRSPKLATSYRKSKRNGAIIGGALGLPFAPLGPVVGGTAGYYIARNNWEAKHGVRKNMGISAFGVNHGDEVSKADEYRNSFANKLNPRSDTKVKRGTSARRYGKVMAGSMGGSFVGSAAGSIPGILAKNPMKAQAGARLVGTVGDIAGTSAARTSNLKRGDVVSTNRSTGKKATRFIGNSGGIGFYGS